MTTTKTCPDCLSDIPAAATFCRFCGERVEGKACPACGVRNWSEAKACRWCGQQFSESRSRAIVESFSVVAKRLPTFLNRGRLLPQKLHISTEKIILSTPGLFNLTQQEEEIPWAKVAGFDYKSGLFWDEVTIETRGQSSSKIGCLAKPDGQRIREVLQELET